MHQAQKEKADAKRAEEARQCSECPRKFSRNRTETRKAFAKRETCSRKCCDIRRVRLKREEIAKDTKICENPDCRKEFSRRVSENSMETNEKFKARRTCSNPCGIAVRKPSHKWEKKSSGGGKKPKPAVYEAPSSAPTESGVKVVKIWRPESWGGEIEVEVAV